MHPLWVQSGHYSASAERISILNTLFDAPGRVRRGDLLVTPTSPASMKVEISTGSAVIAPPKTSYTTGYYVATSTEKYTIDIPAASATNSRVDLIVIKAHDPELIAGDTDNVSIEVVMGTPGTSPIAPQVPNMCVELAKVRVEANTSTVTTATIDTTASPVATLSRDIGGSIIPISSDIEAANVLSNLKKNNTVSTTNPAILFDTRTGQIKYSSDGRTTTNTAGSSFVIGVPRRGSYDESKNLTPIIQSGTIVLKTNAVGDAIFKFPKPFPNGLSTCVATPGDQAVGGKSISANNSYWNLEGVAYKVLDKNGNTYTNNWFRLDYIAIGW